MYPPVGPRVNGSFCWCWASWVLLCPFWCCHVTCIAHHTANILRNSTLGGTYKPACTYLATSTHPLSWCSATQCQHYRLLEGDGGQGRARGRWCQGSGCQGGPCWEETQKYSGLRVEVIMRGEVGRGWKYVIVGVG